MATTAERLHQIMDELHIRQADIIERAKPFAEKYGSKITRQDLSQYCSGKVRPSQQKIFLLAAALDVNEAWLLGYDVPRQRTPALQALTDIDEHPAVARAINAESPLADYMIRNIMADSITQNELEIIEAYRNADDRTRRLVSYMLGIMEIEHGTR